MSKKLNLVLIITFVILVGYFVNLMFQNDDEAILNDFEKYDEFNTKIAHIEYLDTKKAIVFFESGDLDYPDFGSAIYKKGLLGWKFHGSFIGAIPEDLVLGWGFSNLEYLFSDYTDLIRGKILDEEIKTVQVITENGIKYDANIIEYNNGKRFWFLVTAGEDLTSAEVTALSSDGEIIEQKPGSFTEES